MLMWEELYIAKQFSLKIAKVRRKGEAYESVQEKGVQCPVRCADAEEDWKACKAHFQPYGHPLAGMLPADRLDSDVASGLQMEKSE